MTHWWQVRDIRNLIAQGGVSHQAAQSIADYLTGEGWNYSPDARQKGGTNVVDTFRDSDGWFVEVIYSRPRGGTMEPISILIVSPHTVRGNNPPKDTSYSLKGTPTPSAPPIPTP